MQAELAGYGFEGESVASSSGVYKADGNGNSAWQRSLAMNARLNARKRRN